MNVNLKLGSHLIKDILQNTNANESLAYASNDEDKKEAALAYAKDIIKAIEKDYNKNNDTLNRGVLNAAELNGISKYEDELAELNLDDNEGLTKEELASYILAADGLARLKDAAYAGWEFLPGADITEEDLKISIYEASITDGIIDDKNLFALEKMNTKDLKEAAQEIYDSSFKNKCNGFVSFLKMLFIH